MSEAEHLKKLVRNARLVYNDDRENRYDLDIPFFSSSAIWTIYRAIDAAFAEPEERTCEWTYDATRDQSGRILAPGHWKTECGHVCVFSAIQPDYPGYTYCCYCGGKLGVIKVNNPGQLGDDKEAPEPCGWKKVNTNKYESLEPDTELDVAFEMIAELRERVRELEKDVNMLKCKSGHPKDEVLGFSAGHNTREDE